MKLKSLILAFPVLCLACGGPSNDSDPASNADASPYLAKQVVGVNMLTVDTDYDDPCHILGEEYIRGMFKVEEGTELAELDLPNGCEFEWSGNKVAIAFGGRKPYQSIYNAEYEFNKMYQGRKGQVSGQMGETGEKPALSGPAPEGTGSELPATTTDTEDSASSANDKKGNKIQGDSTLGALPLTKPAVSTGRYAAVTGLGDKAVWNAAEGAMHVLYNNHIVTVTVETKDKLELRKEHAQQMAEVIIEKIAEGHHIR